VSAERKNSVLVVEDDPTQRKSIQRILESEGYQVFSADSADKAYGYIADNVDVVLSDLRLEGGERNATGADLLRLWKSKCPDTEFILLTGHGSIDSAVECMKAGAFHYLTKPVNPDELLQVLKRAVEVQHKTRQLDQLRERLDERFDLNNIVGNTAAMQKVFAMIKRAAAVSSTVLILGESGTGKELVAQALHQNSARKSGPLVAVNCAAVPANLVESELFGHVRGAFTGATDRRIGRFEQANGGTLLIDEIGDMELSLQAKLLRVLETMKVTPVGGSDEKHVDVRVIAATSRPLPKMVAERTFREDLYYRLNVLTVELPPLRERRDDIPLLVKRFVNDLGKRNNSPVKGIEPEALHRLQQYDWPGNVRELKNIVERMLVLADHDMLTVRDLPESISGKPPAATAAAGVAAGMSMEDLERAAIMEALERHNGNRTHAARVLGLSVRTLQRKLKKYETDDERIRRLKAQVGGAPGAAVPGGATAGLPGAAGQAAGAGFPPPNPASQSADDADDADGDDDDEGDDTASADVGHGHGHGHGHAAAHAHNPAQIISGGPGSPRPEPLETAAASSGSFSANGRHGLEE
jgi:DNA-binding NtrC family response regulator